MMFEPNGMEVYFEGPFKDRLKSNSSLAFLGVTTAVINEGKNDTKPSKKKRYTFCVTLFFALSSRTYREIYNAIT